MQFQPFIDYIQAEKRYSNHTILSYKKDLEQFQVFLRFQYQQEDVNIASFQQIRSWIVHLMNEGNSSKTVNRKISTLRSFYKYLLKKGIISINPTHGIQAPKMPKRNPVFVPESNMETLFEKLEFADDFEGVRDKTILEMFYGTGIRLSELIGLNIKDIDHYNQTIKVLGKRNKERIIPLGKSLIMSLNSYLDKRHQQFTEINDVHYIFLSIKGKKMNPKSVYTIVNKYLGAVTTVEKKSPHVLRHTFATHMLNNGADINAIKELLGHSSLAATQVYTHNTLEKMKSVYKKAHPKA